MKKLIIFLMLAWQLLAAFAQPVNGVNSNDQQNNLKFEVLAGGNYTFEQARVSNKYTFVKGDSLVNDTVYWLKAILHNPSGNSGEYNLIASPNYDNTLFYYNHFDKKWIAHRSGLPVKTATWLLGIHPYMLTGNSYDTVYIRISTNSDGMVHHAFKAKVTLIPKDLYQQHEQDIFTAWMVGTLVLLLFFLNNLYIYVNFRDKTVAYYLIIQLAGMVYLTSYWDYFDRLLPHSVISFTVTDRLHFYDYNSIIMHLAIVGLFYGFIQLTRAYLNTKMNLPVCDRLLRYGLYTYVVLSVINAAINFTGFEIEYHAVIYDNMLCLLLILLMLYTSIAGYRQGIPTAGPFLLANILPLGFMISLTIYHVVVSTNGDNGYWMPVLAACSQTLAFSIALVSRTRAINNALQQKIIESAQLEYRNELLHEKVALHQRELVSSTLFVVQKNELLAQLKSQIKELKHSDRYNAGKNLNEMITLLENNNQLDADWHKFKMHFEQMHPNFFDQLKKQHPTLTQKEARLYTYLQMNLSHKEIAALLDIDQASVRRAKSRLLKKMQLPDEE